ISSLIVKLASGADAATVIARDGGTDAKSIGALGLHVVDVAQSSGAAAPPPAQADSDVVSAELDQTRQARGEATDPGYASQWALPKIGWDLVHNNINPTGTAKLAVLDTGVSSAGGEPR